MKYLYNINVNISCTYKYFVYLSILNVLDTSNALKKNHFPFGKEDLA